MNQVRDPEYPTEERLRIYGDFSFLAMRNPLHRKMPGSILRDALEPPILLGQYKIFRFDGVPRGALTWAWLSEDSEKKYLNGHGFHLADWRSGDRLWLIDFIAPYPGLARGIAKWMRRPGNMPEPVFAYRRVNEQMSTRRVVRVDLRGSKGQAEIVQS